METPLPHLLEEPSRLHLGGLEPSRADRELVLWKGYQWNCHLFEAGCQQPGMGAYSSRSFLGFLDEWGNFFTEPKA